VRTYGLIQDVEDLPFGMAGERRQCRGGPGCEVQQVLPDLPGDRFLLIQDLFGWDQPAFDLSEFYFRFPRGGKFSSGSRSYEWIRVALR
jgi:hypothetical protein